MPRPPAVPVELAVARVANRVETGGDDVPEDKVRSRHQRLWAHVATTIEVADEARVYDNTHADRPLRLVATYIRGRPVGTPDWPPWAPTTCGTPDGDPWKQHPIGKIAT